MQKKHYTLLFPLILVTLIGCISKTDSFKEISDEEKENYWNTNLDTAKFKPYTIEDMDKVPVSDTVFIKMYARSDEMKPLKEVFNQDHKKFILEFINNYEIPIENVSIGAPKQGYVDGVGVYIKENLWLNAREHSAGINTKKRGFIPPMPYDKLDSAFIANFKFTPEMLKAGLHGRVGAGFQVYPDSTLNIFQIMNTTLGIDKEIAHVLHSTGKWIPAYDSITNNNVVSEMVYPFPIQHPDSAKLEPQR